LKLNFLLFRHADVLNNLKLLHGDVQSGRAVSWVGVEARISFLSPQNRNFFPLSSFSLPVLHQSLNGTSQCLMDQANSENKLYVPVNSINENLENELLKWLPFDYFGF